MHRIIDLMFDSPKLEHRFASFVRSEHEMGGYLFVRWGPSFADKLHYKRRHNLIKRVDNALFIFDWLFMPNVADRPATSYRPVDWQFSRDTAELTRQSKREWGWGSIPLAFHTHGDGIQGLSPLDMDVALKYEREYPSMPATTIVVSSAPFRAIAWNVQYSKDKYPKPEAAHGEFHSWREKRFADWRELAAGH